MRTLQLSAVVVLGTLITLSTVSACGEASDQVERPATAEVNDLGAVARYADEHGLSGLSPVSLRAVRNRSALNGDTKDHPRYRSISWPAFNGDAKDHPGYGSDE
jgi:hypothetical protein